jgi:hypothetical protein
MWPKWEKQGWPATFLKVSQKVEEKWKVPD